MQEILLCLQLPLTCCTNLSKAKLPQWAKPQECIMTFSSSCSHLSEQCLSWPRPSAAVKSFKDMYWNIYAQSLIKHSNLGVQTKVSAARFISRHSLQKPGPCQSRVSKKPFLPVSIQKSLYFHAVSVLLEFSYTLHTLETCSPLLEIWIFLNGKSRIWRIRKRLFFY